MPCRVPQIAGAGVCCQDHLVVTPPLAWGETAPIQEYHEQGGGLVATALVACARLGAATSLVSLLGDDAVGDAILRDLEIEGVATRHVVRIAEQRSPFSIVHVCASSGERTILHHKPEGLDWPGNTPLDVLAEADVLLIDAYYPELSLAAAQAAHAAGVPVVADILPSSEHGDLLRHVDVLIAPRHFARDAGLDSDLDAALTALHAWGPRTALITLGADGWVYSGPDGRGRGEAFPVDVVDTTGAGDVFHGAYAYALARGGSTAACARFAAAAAALKCTAFGGRGGIPDLPAVAAFLSMRLPESEWPPFLRENMTG